jgi:carbon monoxide dehydrogenase subunit G
MEFGGYYIIAAPRNAVWAALNDTAVLRAVIPGCERIAWTGAAALELAIRVHLGPVHPVLHGELALSNVVPAESYTLSGRGRGGMLGLARGAADITLAEAGDATVLAFAAHGSADGPIMRLGRKLVGNSARQVIDGFFSGIGAQMGVPVRPLAVHEF